MCTTSACAAWRLSSSRGSRLGQLIHPESVPKQLKRHFRPQLQGASTAGAVDARARTDRAADGFRNSLSQCCWYWDSRAEESILRDRLAFSAKSPGLLIIPRPVSPLNVGIRFDEAFAVGKPRIADVDAAKDLNRYDLIIVGVSQALNTESGLPRQGCHGARLRDAEQTHRRLKLGMGRIRPVSRRTKPIVRTTQSNDSHVTCSGPSASTGSYRLERFTSRTPSICSDCNLNHQFRTGILSSFLYRFCAIIIACPNTIVLSPWHYSPVPP